jgi:phosphonate transport system substrate-binding protein
LANRKGLAALKIEFDTQENKMFNRRTVIGAAGAAAVLTSTRAFAQAWKAQFPELNFAIVPVENSQDMLNRWQPFADFLGSQIGVKVNVRVANDYAAVIEGQRAGNIHIANYGAASFARAEITGVKTDAFATDVNSDGTHGYFSVFYVLAKSPYQKIEDLKGKNLGLVDPNSTSGNNVPRFVLNQKGINPDQYFGKVVYTGTHENAVLALAQGTVDVAANQWTNPNYSTLTDMLLKGVLKNADGSPMKYTDFRIINTSDVILNGPYCYLNNLPDDLKASIVKAFFDAPTKAPAVYAKLSDGQNKGYVAMTNKDYDATVELVKFVDTLRKQ